MFRALCGKVLVCSETPVIGSYVVDVTASATKNERVSNNLTLICIRLDL